VALRKVNSDGRELHEDRESMGAKAHSRSFKASTDIRGTSVWEYHVVKFRDEAVLSTSAHIVIGVTKSPIRKEAMRAMMAWHNGTISDPPNARVGCYFHVVGWKASFPAFRGHARF
jgi:hypothetical protein